MGVRCVTHHHTTEELNTGSSLVVFVKVVRKSEQNGPSSTHFDISRQYETVLPSEKRERAGSNTNERVIQSVDGICWSKEV